MYADMLARKRMTIVCCKKKIKAKKNTFYHVFTAHIKEKNMVEKNAIFNSRIISNDDTDIINRCEPLYLPSQIDSTSSLLCCLEDACQSLIEQQVFDNQLYEKIRIALERSDVNELLLTLDECAAIHLYTMEWTDEPQNSFYIKLNHILRTGDENTLKPWLNYLHLLTNALLKLP